MDDREQAWHETPSQPPAASGVLLFAVCFLLLLVGFWLMGYGYETGLGPVFSGGLLAAGLAFMIPLVRTR